MTDRLERLPDHEGTQRAIQDDLAARMRHACPGIIVSVSGQTCAVQPSIMESVQLQDGSTKPLQLPLLVNVPILFMGGGGLTITVPVKTGDEVQVIFNDRCIDAWHQSGGVQRQADARMHSLSDAVAIPGLRSMLRTLSNISTTSMQMRTDDGAAYVELTASGAVNIVAPGGFKVMGNTQVVGTTDLDGNVTSEGTLMNNGKNVGSALVVTGVQPGSGVSGNPL